MKFVNVKQLLFIITSSAVATVLIVMALLSMKDSACKGLLETINSATTYTGVCASDGNGFALMALNVFIVTMIFVAINIWAMKRFKI